MAGRAARAVSRGLLESAVVGAKASAQSEAVIASVAFRNFKALRNTELALAPFNLVIGPNGSGKTSLIQALLQLRGLAGLPPGEAEPDGAAVEGGAVITWTLGPPYDGWKVEMSCVHELRCDRLRVLQEGEGTWEEIKARIQTARAYAFEHRALGESSRDEDGGRLAADGRNLAAVLRRWQRETPDTFLRLSNEVSRILTEYDGVDFHEQAAGEWQVGLRLKGEANVIAGPDLSQGTLYVLALLTLALDPSSPAIVCIEEIDRGIHPRLLRDVRDALYQLCYPDTGAGSGGTQVIATTHSPYLLDLFRDHPEEVVIAQKQGAAAHFSRLSERDDLGELLGEGSLGDIWFSGVLGGVPEES